MNPFSPEAIKQAVQAAVDTNILPADKSHAVLIAPVFEKGQFSIKAVYAQRIGEHWQVGANIEYHGSGDVGAGITAVASW